MARARQQRYTDAKGHTYALGYRVTRQRGVPGIDVAHRRDAPADVMCKRCALKRADELGAEEWAQRQAAARRPYGGTGPLYGTGEPPSRRESQPPPRARIIPGGLPGLGKRSR
jgi:hypothetical protein